jgi:methylenetetrahydrofolate reductase (NADPH)
MHVRDVYSRPDTAWSFEFFPPRTQQGAESLFKAIGKLEALRPDFVSVTYGAGGSTRDLTHDLVVRIKTTTPLDPIPHLTCVRHSRAEIREILERYAEVEVGNIMALAGDPPKQRESYDRSGDDFQHAADLVRFIRRFNEEGGHPDSRGFGIGIAGFPEGHPATPNRLDEMDYLKAKVDEGADYICTQLFFDNRDFYDFCERCVLSGIEVPVVAGVMPITSRSGMQRMAELALGAHFPAALQKAVARCSNDRAVERVGTHWATEQCRDLLDHGVSGIHLYTLNRSGSALEIYRSLGIADASS